MSRNNYLNESLSSNAHVYLEGEEIKFVSLSIDQSFGEHHSFQVIMDYDSMKQNFLSNPLEQMKHLGKFVDIELQQGSDNANAYQFRGIIQDISTQGQEGKHGYLVIQGLSTTVLLERGKRMDIFSNMDLQEIFKDLTEGITNKRLTSVNKPIYNGKIDFVMQYNESDWQFLQRLSAITGETLFYTGMDLVFGQYKDWSPIQVTYDKEITSFKFGTKLLANNFIRYQYLSEQDTTLSQEAPDKLENTNDYLTNASDKSKELTGKRLVRTPLSISVADKGSLDELVSREKVINGSQTIYVEGTSKTCAPRIGRLLTIQMPDNMPGSHDLGTYRVIKVKHTIDQNHRYQSQFEAIPSSLEFYPTPELHIPQVDSLLGTIISNEDPQGQGRVRVEFAFAQDKLSDTWMRVMSPNAGSSNEVNRNRGMMFVPEKGDQVMVGFEGGDPNRPYVMGSMYHGKNGQGGQEDNHIKSIITRTGHTIEFDDAESTLGITVKDKNGNVIHLDTKGKNIEVTAPETMTFTAKNININAQEKVEITGTNINENAQENLTQFAQKMTSSIDEDYQLVSKTIKAAADVVDIYSQKENMTLYSKKNVETKSGSKKIRLS